MKTDQQQRLIYYLFGPFMVVIFASTWITWKYPDYSNYVMAGMGVVVVLLLALAIYMIRNTET